MKTILDIANTTFWEVIRDKILYGLILMAIVLLLVSSAMAQLSFAEQAKITMDFSLFVLNISTVVISIFLGAQLLLKEIENKTLLTLLTHPVSRMQFLIGKILGLFYIVVILTLVLGAVLFLQSWYYSYANYKILFYPMTGILLEALIILSLTISLSTIFRVSVTVVVALFIFLIGHSIENIRYFAEQAEGQFLGYLYHISNTLLPNFELMNWKGLVTTQVAVDSTYFVKVIVYSFMWFIIFNLISLFTFSRRDIT